jgi:hypothetical protein
MSEEIRVITKAQYEEYMELKKQAKTTQTKRWKPKDGETYFFILADGDIVPRIWENDVVDNDCFRLGNCFETEEEAQKEFDRKLVEQELLDLCDWESGEWVCIRYDVGRKLFDFASFGFLVYSPYRFASLTSCRRAIDTLGTEKLKLIFRID